MATPAPQRECRKTTPVLLSTFVTAQVVRPRAHGAWVRRGRLPRRPHLRRRRQLLQQDRKSVGVGKRVDLGGCRIIKKKKKKLGHVTFDTREAYPLSREIELP